LKKGARKLFNEEAKSLDFKGINKKHQRERQENRRDTFEFFFLVLFFLFSYQASECNLEVTSAGKQATVGQKQERTEPRDNSEDNGKTYGIGWIYRGNSDGINGGFRAFLVLV
jgi:hypothetical protein